MVVLALDQEGGGQTSLEVRRVKFPRKSAVQSVFVAKQASGRSNVAMSLAVVSDRPLRAVTLKPEKIITSRQGPHDLSTTPMKAALSNRIEAWETSQQSWESPIERDAASSATWPSSPKQRTIGPNPLSAGNRLVRTNKPVMKARRP